MAKREFLLLANTLEDISKICVVNWLVSQKMDGLRVLWDGGISRGIQAKAVPYANTEKDDRYVNRDYLATGLWSRNGNVVRAPEWFLDLLPKIPLDGELWGGYGKWERTSSITKQINPSERDWREIQYHVFDSPPLSMVFLNGEINTINYKKVFSAMTMVWVLERAEKLNVAIEPKYREFENTIWWLKSLGIENDHVKILEQTRLPGNRSECERIINQKMEEVIAWGGEGLMVRRDQSYWVPERSHNLLKIKKWYDAEATVKGYTWGKATDKGSKLLGMMGALVVEWQEKTFEVSGFTFPERELVLKSSGINARMIGVASPGKLASEDISSLKFPIGSKITFRYRDLTANNIPKNANYLRKAE